MCGALVRFGGGAKTLKVSVPSDFSAVRLTNLPLGSGPSSVVGHLARSNFNIPATSIRLMPQGDGTSGCAAIVQVEDPSFAERLRSHLSTKKIIPGLERMVATRINATLPQAQGANARRIDCKKVHLSWHKPTRTAWLNFSSEDDADEVQEGFTDGGYEVQDKTVKATGPTYSETEYNASWTVRLAELPHDVTVEDILEVIPSELTPRSVGIGAPTYTESPQAASEKVKKMLQAIGPLDSWECGTFGERKRIKASARFQNEEDARRAATSLDRTLLPFSKSARLTEQLVQTARLKVSDRVCTAAREEIEAERPAWKSKHVVFVAYPPVRGNRVLKLEGENNKNVADANGRLEGQLAGEIALHDGKPIWATSFGVGGGTHGKLGKLEARFDVMIVRNKRRSRLHLYGAPDKRREAVKKLISLAAEEASVAYNIELNAEQFSWACRGGFGVISSALGPDVVGFDVTSAPRRILVSGPSGNYKRALRIVTSMEETDQSGKSASAEDCTVCWTEAENPVRTRCARMYCADCFEALCFSNPTGTSDFRWSSRRSMRRRRSWGSRTVPGARRGSRRRRGATI